MIQIIDNQEIISEYLNFEIPVLAHKKLRGDNFVVANKSFKDLFFPDKTSKVSLETTMSDFFIKITTTEDFLWKGNCYKVDKLNKGMGLTFFFISLSRKTFQQSFLWLKHDLLNILNPIMGFSDILMEMDHIAPESLELIEKINHNSRRIYHQINQISLLQSMASNNFEINAEEYNINIFFQELVDKLVINNNIEPHNIHLQICKNSVHVNIANHEFRTVLENQLIIFSKWQEAPHINIDCSVFQRKIKIEIRFENCKIPNNKLGDITKVDLFVSTCKNIDKLQNEGFNYLMLSHIVDLLSGNIQFVYNEDQASILQIIFPISKLNNGENHVNPLMKTNLQNTTFTNEDVKIDLPPSMEKELKQICKHFDGLLILDEWEELANKIEKINSPFQILEIQQIVDEIRIAIRTYHVEKLKKIHQNCKFIFG